MKLKTSLQTGKTPRLLGKDSEIFQGDNITQLRYHCLQRRRQSHRPNSSFSITEYNNSRCEQQIFEINAP